MARINRSERVDLGTTPYYHCHSRCVRRAFLCGDDAATGKNFDHRKGWLEARLRKLSASFAVQVCAYAVMSNHFHLVLRVDEALAKSWSAEEVVARYGALFPLAKEQFDASPKREQKRYALAWRQRLCDLSWMMRYVNEWVARKANKEDGVKGHFWEGRFSCQPLLDEGALLTCMAYVDLNPVRAGLAKSLKTAKFTSIHARLKEASSRMSSRMSAHKAVKEEGAVPSGLMAFADQTANQTAGQAVDQVAHPQSKSRKAARDSKAHSRNRSAESEHVERAACVPMDFLAYVELLSWTGKHVREKGPSGRLSRKTPALLAQVGLAPEAWLKTMRSSGLYNVGTLGHVDLLQELARAQGKRWIRGQGWARRAYAA